MADISTWLLHRIGRYRVKVVRQNLASSFPDKSKKELRKIEKEYYRFLGDYFVETIKLTSMSEKEMRKRMKFRNPELPVSDLEKGKNVTLYLGHYCNWEWVSSIPLHLPKNDNIKGIQIYKPLHNKALDDVFLKIRNRFGAKSVKKMDTLRELINIKREGKISITGYIADQVPNYESIHIWLPFLNHDTGVFSGAERISRSLQASAYYIDIHRVKRGYYEAEYVKISDDASKEQPEYLTRTYFHLLEKTILRAPAFWLWSHRRWKRTRK